MIRILLSKVDGKYILDVLDTNRSRVLNVMKLESFTEVVTQATIIIEQWRTDGEK